MTKLRLQHRLVELLAQLGEEQRERVASDVAERYRLPKGERRRWRVVEGVPLTLPQLAWESIVERTDGGDEAYADAAPGHPGRALAVATALNAIEDELLAPPLAPRR